LRELEAARDPVECKGLLKSYLKIEDAGFDRDRQDILLDFHFYNYAFCKKLGFGPTKISTFLSIMKDTIDKDFSQHDAVNTIKASFEQLKKTLLMHCIERPPWSVGIFQPEDLQLLSDFVLNGYYRQFRLYKYLFTRRVQVEFTQTLSNDVGCARMPRPLAEGLPQVVKTSVGEGEDDEKNGV